MLFNSIEFLFLFLPVCVICAYIAGAFGHRWFLLSVIGFSFIFYGRHNVSNVSILVASLVFNYTISLLIEAYRSKALLAVGISANIGLLTYFKYSGFLFGPSFANIALPLAISFFTFQQIAYLADIYLRRIKPFSVVDYVFCVTFFPHLIAGPIVKYDEIRGQIAAKPAFLSPAHLRQLEEAIVWITLGLAKKILLADSIGTITEVVFDSPNPPDTVSAWIGSFAFTLQIYLDFSAYSEIAIGLGLLFGIRLPLNFNAPYSAQSIVEFWRRWHITLSQFLRDYIYIPLGGNRKGPRREFVNIAITMLIGGLWHGAAWTFVAWGAYHGMLIITSHLLRRTIALPRGVAVAATFFVVWLGWVLFRAPSFERAYDVYSAMAFMPRADAVSHLPLELGTCVVMALASAIIWAKPTVGAMAQLIVQYRRAYPYTVLGLIFSSSICVLLVAAYGNRFIYFVF